MLPAFRRKVFGLLGIFLGAIFGCALGLVIGNVSGGIMASLFWHKGNLFSFFMIGLCLLLAIVSMYASFQHFKAMILLYKRWDTNNLIVDTVKAAVKGVFFITFFMQIMIWGITTIVVLLIAR